jgi:hypothetical protein
VRSTLQKGDAMARTAAVAKRVLSAAREMVADGWGQGWQGSGCQGGRTVCAGIALDRAWRAHADGLTFMDPLYRQLDRTFRKAAGTKRGIIEWNDAKGRTQRQVIAAFTKAIRLSRSIR